MKDALNAGLGRVGQVLETYHAAPRLREVGHVRQLDQSVVRVSGLPGVQVEERVELPGGVHGLALDLAPDAVGVALLGDGRHLRAGDVVRRSGRVVDVPVGEALLGRVLDATGRPLDDLGSLEAEKRWPVERDAPAIMARAAVSEPLATGIKVIDALIPVGRGQRELILGDRQTGKTALALDAIVNQRDQDVVCVYCAIGQRASAVAQVIDQLHRHEALAYSVVVVARGEDPPGLQYLTPYAATSIAEYFMRRGRDVLIVYDDLTAHARAYRELSLLLRRPPGREAFPGDIFYIHAHLLERATRLREGGSLTALPILETEAQNLSAYIPTNLVSITDGQIYLSPDLFHKGLLPAVDVGRSVSRVGGRAQLPAYREVAGALKLSYAQFEELEVFARFGTRLDEATRRTIDHGRRVREILRQPNYAGIPPAQQVAVLLATSEGLLDDLPPQRLAAAERALREAVQARADDVCRRIEAGEELTDADRQRLLTVSREALAGLGADGVA
ncbi:MAG: alternate F1F0 ATPase, F1 subunit alpha [Candidatus Competibacterales bacterium]|nr:alternate F1F0 ATPase, F1 subunit alpha [Candidatus Competibacterales bacterium]